MSGLTVSFWQLTHLEIKLAVFWKNCELKTNYHLLYCVPTFETTDFFLHTESSVNCLLLMKFLDTLLVIWLLYCDILELVFYLQFYSCIALVKIEVTKKSAFTGDENLTAL